MKKAYDVYVTKDYDMFKRLPGNRDIPEKRISKIANSIQKIGWIRNPIVVNEKMEVIDGQGRLTALQRLGLPVEYVVAEGAGTEACINMNMNMVNWSQPDFIKSYAEQGNINYQRLLHLINNYVNGNIHIIFSALFRISKPRNYEIKEGTIMITNEQYVKAIERLEYVDPIYQELCDKRLPGSIIKLMQALVYYYDYPEIDKERLKNKILKYITLSTPWVTNPDCEKEVENIYNYHAVFKDKQSIQHLLTDERMRRKAEISEQNRERAFARPRDKQGNWTKEN